MCVCVSGDNKGADTGVTYFILQTDLKAELSRMTSRKYPVTFVYRFNTGILHLINIIVINGAEMQ